MTVEARVPITEVPIIKQAARELEIEMITGEPDGVNMICYFLISDYGSLISIGCIAGINKSYTSLHGPVQQFIDTIEEKLEKFENKSKPNE